MRSIGRKGSDWGWEEGDFKIKWKSLNYLPQATGTHFRFLSTRRTFKLLLLFFKNMIYYFQFARILKGWIFVDLIENQSLQS